MSSSIENKVRIGLAILFIVLLANGLASYRATQTLIANEQRVAHSHQVIGEIESILSTIKDAETGERGYLITGSEDFLAPYNDALAQIDRQVKHFEVLTADNPRQQARIPTLRQKIADRLAILKRGIEIHRSGDAAGAQQLTKEGPGRQAMDELRLLAADMEADENIELQQRAEESNQSAAASNLTFVIGNLITLGLLLAIGYIINRDIAVRMRAQEEVRAQREWLQITLASIGDGVIASDAKGAVTFLNPIAEKLTGWTLSEAQGRPLLQVFDIVNEQTRQVAENPALRAIRGGTIVGLANHTVLRRRGGGEIAVDDTASPIKTSSGKLLGAILIFRDVTERRRADEERTRLMTSERKALERAEAANRTKDEFLATLSHELRTPLTAIYGWVSILKNSEFDAKQLEKALEVIDRNVRAQTQLVDDLLSVSRIITGNLKMQMELIDPLPATHTAIDSLRPAAEAKSIQIVTKFDQNIGRIFVDGDRWQQVLWNLLTNALKFTPKGGEIRIEFCREGHFALLTVTDTGEGIEPAFLSNVFERFSQADSTTTRRHGGLGLGLSIVRHIVELHGGTVMVRSDGRDKGSTFIVQLPIPETPDLELKEVNSRGSSTREPPA